MLHRRRAAAATVVTEFFAIVGTSFGPYLENRAPEAAVDSAREINEAENVSAVLAASHWYSPPFLLERAALSEVEGRFHDALVDLGKLLDTYPAFLQAATQAARLVLAAGKAERALYWLAPVEYELNQTRQGAGALADVLRATGHCCASKPIRPHRTCSRRNLRQVEKDWCTG